MYRIDLPLEKKVKHLTLFREPRTITSQEFNALSFKDRFEMVRVSDSSFRYNLLLEAHDGPRIMEGLSGQDVFLMLKEVGVEAIEHLMPMVSPDQFTFCLDLDCWSEDYLEADKALQWLEHLLACEEEKILDVAREMNFELLAFILKKHVTILCGPEATDASGARIEAERRDGGYEVSYHNDLEAKLFTTLFDVLFRLDPGFYNYMMTSIRGELDAMLEESVYKQRTGRLHDAGFPDPYEAKAVYGWLDPESFDGKEGKLPMESAEEEMAQPAFMLIEANPRDLLAAALAESLTPSTNWELACLANKVLMADQVDLAEKTAVQQSLSQMYETFNLALEYLCTSKEDAVELLGSAYFQHLFQVGNSLKIQLQRKAKDLKQSEIGPFVDVPFRSFLEALLKKPHVLYFSGLDNPAESQERSFRSAIDLKKAEKWLAKIDAQRQLFADRMPFDLPTEDSFELIGCNPAKVEDLTLSQIFLTALANRILGREFTPEPISVEELPGLHGSITKGGHLDAKLREDTVSWVDSLVAGAGSFADWCLDVWELEFCSIDPDQIDPRFVGGLIVRVD